MSSLHILDINSYQIYDYKYFPPVCRLPLHFVDCFLCYVEVISIFKTFLASGLRIRDFDLVLSDLNAPSLRSYSPLHTPFSWLLVHDMKLYAHMSLVCLNNRL